MMRKKILFLLVGTAFWLILIPSSNSAGESGLVGAQIDNKWLVTFSRAEAVLTQGQFTIINAGTYKIISTDFTPSRSYQVYVGSNLLGNYSSSSAGIIQFSAAVSANTTIGIGVKPATPTTCPGDLNGDRQVNALDWTIIELAYGAPTYNPYDPRADVSGPDRVPDGVVNIFDLFVVAFNWGRDCTQGAPAVWPQNWLSLEINLSLLTDGVWTIEIVSPSNIAALGLEFDFNPHQLRLEGLNLNLPTGDPANTQSALFLLNDEKGVLESICLIDNDQGRALFLKSIRSRKFVLAQVKASLLTNEPVDVFFRNIQVSDGQRNFISADVKKTLWHLPTSSQLLQNFPNPFNPDTWIPYQLVKDSAVVINIFSETGKLVRKLDLGNRPAGFYNDKNRAAYWDGKNQNGEKVASGVYFYTIQAGDFVATKKMVVSE